MGKGSSGHKTNAAAKRNRQHYVLMGRYSINKARKLRKTIASHPNDDCAKVALKRLLRGDN